MRTKACREADERRWKREALERQAEVRSRARHEAREAGFTLAECLEYAHLCAEDA